MAIILAVSGCFEIIESVVAEIVAPGKGVDWLGGQGDEWDAQNDMIAALVGALLMMSAVAVVERLCPHLFPHPRGKEDAQRPMRATSTRTTAGKIDIYFLPIVAACYVVFWVALAVHPLDRGDWLLENLLIFISVAVLGFTYRRFQFSHISYVLILIFLSFHTIGANYTYAKVPAGFWLQHWLHLSRNHYDRVIHFSFGLLLLYPMRELLHRTGQAKPLWDIWLSVAALAALSSFFEIIEAVIAQLVRPDLGAAYLGTQGDVWDAQKDMGAAFVGAVLTAVFLAWRSRQMQGR